jgi:hypothetical protein
MMLPFSCVRTKEAACGCGIGKKERKKGLN